MKLPISKSTVNPVGNRVVLTIEKLEEKVGDIVIAYAVNDKRVQECGRELGTILALGPEAFNNDYITDTNKDWYTSVFYYNDDHYNIF